MTLKQLKKKYEKLHKEQAAKCDVASTGMTPEEYAELRNDDGKLAVLEQVIKDLSEIEK